MIYRLKATIKFGQDEETGVWPVAHESDWSHRIEVTREIQEGRKYVWDIPFDLNDTEPDPSGDTGCRIHPIPFDAAEMEATEQITSFDHLDSAQDESE